MKHAFKAGIVFSGLIGGACVVQAAPIETITVSAEACRMLPRHVPDASVTYQPGVDVHGRAVAPADLDSGYGYMMPAEITIPITVDLANRLGRARTDSDNPSTAERPLLAYEGKAAIGEVTVKGNQIYWNGEFLGPKDQAALVAVCQSRAAATKAPPPRPDLALLIRHRDARLRRSGASPKVRQTFRY